MSFEETTARVENAFRAMMAIGFSADKAEPVFLELMEVYGQNWAYIEKDNYRVFADAMFQRDKAEAAEGSKKILDSEAVEPSKKVMKGKLHVKMPGVPVVTPKEEPNELTQTCLQSPRNGKSKEIQPIYLQTPSTEKGSVTDGSCSSDVVRLKEPNIEASLVLAPRMKSVSNHALVVPKDGPIAQTGVANQKRKRQFTEVARTPQVELMKKDMGVSEKVQFGTGSREGALGCLLKTVDETTAELEARYECLLEKHYALQVEHHACPGFIKILEVKVENLEAMVAEERKHAALIKAEMSRMDKEIDEHKKKVDEQAEARMKGFNRHMDITERGQFAVDVLVEYNEEVQKLEHRYVDLGKRHQAMKDAHATCMSEIESIKTEKSRLEKRAEDAETLALARDKHLGKALENFRATQSRLNEAVADASAARSRAAEAREEGLLAGKVEGTKTYLASDECKNLFNWTHVACYDDLIRKVEAGATVEELKADRGRYMEENGLADSDEATEEFK